MIEMSVSEISDPMTLTVLKLDGELDAAYYEEVIAKGAELYEAGTRDLLLDMSGLIFLDSSGLVSLHAILRQMRGEDFDSSGRSWGSLMDINEAGAGGRPKEAHLKLYGPQPEVQKALEISGLVNLLEIYTDWDQALASFD